MKKNISAAASSIAQSRLFLILSLLLFISLVWANFQAFMRAYEADRVIATLEEKKKTLEKDKIDLLRRREEVGSDRYLEEVGRLNFNLAKEGENVAVIKIDGDFSTSSVELEDTQSQRVANPKKWWYHFFGSRDNRVST